MESSAYSFFLFLFGREGDGMMLVIRKQFISILEKTTGIEYTGKKHPDLPSPTHRRGV